MEWIRENKRLILRSLFFGLVVFAILISLTGFWLNRVFFDSKKLSEVTSASLQQESSRDSMSSLIVNQMFEDRPILRNTVGPRLQPVISGLLGTEVADSAIEFAIEKLHAAMTINQSEPIAIDLTPIKGVIVNIQTVLGRSEEERKVNPDNIPDEIVLIEQGKLPDIRTPSVVVLWLSPIAAVFATAGMGYWIYRGRKAALLKRIRITGYIMLAAGTLALLVGPLTEPLIVQLAKRSQGQVILSNLYNSLLESFNQQATTLVVFALLVIIITLALPHVTKVIPKTKAKPKPKKTKK